MSAADPDQRVPPSGMPSDRVMGGIRVTARALITRPADRRLLVMEARDSVKDESFFVPLGGGMRFGESAEATVRREVREELRTELARCELLTVLENHFEQEGRRLHEIVFVFGASLLDESVYASEFFNVIDGDSQEYTGSWRSLSSFRTGSCPDLPPLYPEPLATWLRENAGVVA